MEFTRLHDSFVATRRTKIRISKAETSGEGAPNLLLAFRKNRGLPKVVDAVSLHDILLHFTVAFTKSRSETICPIRTRLRMAAWCRR